MTKKEYIVKSFTLDKELVVKLEARALAEDRNLSNLIKKILSDELSRSEK